MTAIIGMNLGYYVMLAADTRTTYYPPGSPPFWLDNTEKVCRTQPGIVTGMGYSDFTDAVKVRFAAEEPGHTERMVAIIREERARFEQTWPGDERVQHHVRNINCWMASYGTIVDDGRSPAEPTLRLALIHPQHDYQLALIQRNKALVGYPDGMTPEQAAPMTELINEQLKPMNSWDEFQSNMEYHVALAGSVIKCLAAINDGVSPLFQVGVHTLRHGCAISPISDDGRFSLSFST